MTPKEADISTPDDTTVAVHDADDFQLFIPPTVPEAGFCLGAWADESSSDDESDELPCCKIHPLVHRSSDGSIVIPKIATLDTTAKNKNEKKKHDDTRDEHSSHDTDEQSCTTLNDMQQGGHDDALPTSPSSSASSPSRKVRFCHSVRVVQFIKTRPEDASRLYYSCHELQKIIDDHEAERLGGVGLGGMEYLSPL